MAALRCVLRCLHAMRRVSERADRRHVGGVRARRSRRRGSDDMTVTRDALYDCMGARLREMSIMMRSAGVRVSGAVA